MSGVSTCESRTGGVEKPSRCGSESDDSASTSASRTATKELHSPDWLNDNSSNGSREPDSPPILFVPKKENSPAAYNPACFDKDFVLEWVDSPVRPHGTSTVPRTENGNPKDWVESPIRPHGKQNHNTEAYGMRMRSKAHMQANAPGHLAPQQPFMFGALPPPSGAPPPPLPSGNLNFGIGMAEHPQQQNVTWYCVAFAGGPGVVLRSAPDFEAPPSGAVLQKNEVFSVNQEAPGPDGRIYLHLADGRGWAFDDSALSPQDPSVVRMDFPGQFLPLSNPPAPPHNVAALQHGQPPQLEFPQMGMYDPVNESTLPPAPVTLSCPVCNCQVGATAKFCMECGNRVQMPPGLVQAPTPQDWPPCHIQHPMHWY